MSTSRYDLNFFSLFLHLRKYIVGPFDVTNYYKKKEMGMSVYLDSIFD